MKKNFNNKKLRKQAATVLLACRCGFVDQPKLTKKGKGWFPAWFWRMWFEVLCLFSHEQSKRMCEFLEYCYHQTEADKILNEAFEKSEQE